MKEEKMKQRRTKILALLLSAAMAVGSPATVFTVSAEEWQVTEEGTDFEDGFEDFTESDSGLSLDGAGETFGDPESDSEGFGEFFSSEEAFSGAESTGELENIAGTELTETEPGEKTGYADGTYVPDGFTFSGGSGKVEITCPSIVIENGIIYGNILFSSTKYTQIKLNEQVYPVLSTDNGSLFKIPVVLNQNMVIEGTTIAMGAAHAINYTIKITQDVNKFTPAEEKADYTAVDAAIASIPEDLSVYTDESVAAVTAAKNAIVRDYGKDRQAEVDKMAADLKAAIEALALKDTDVEATELAVVNTTGMFKVTKATLQTTAEGQILLVTLGSKGYENVFKGTYEEAVANGNNRDNWIKYESVDGAYQFAIPVTAGETKIPLVSISKNRLNAYESGTGTLENAFLARQLVIDYENKTLTTGDYDHAESLVVTNNATMFKVAGASLHTIGSPAANNYSETLELTMGSDSLDKVYVGNAETADSAVVANDALAITDRKVNILVSENEKGGNSILNYLEKPFVLSFHSKKNDNWTSKKVFMISKKNGTLKIVNYAPVTDVKLDVTEKEIFEGQSFDLTATVTPKDTSDLIVWSSSDEKVATVKDGKVTGVGEGTAKIKITAGEFSATCNVTVLKKDFKYTVQVLVTKENTRTKNATGAVATATDADGNVIEATLNASNMLEFPALDATKTYTLKVSREDYYTVTERKLETANNAYEFTPTGEWEYTATISRADANKQQDVIFQMDKLKAALKKVPSDFSSYTDASAKAVQDVLNSIHKDSKDWTQRDAEAEALTEALSELKIVKNGVYAVAANVSTGLAMLNLRLIVEDGEMKAQFVGSSSTYTKLYMGSSTDAKKAENTDPNMILPDNNGEVYTNCNGFQGYQFTIPVSGFAKEITFSVCGRKSKWSEQTFEIDSATLKNYVEATEISLDKTEYDLKEKQSVTLKETVGPEDASYKKVFWKSSDDKIAKVADGKVTGLKAGKVTITVSDGKNSAQCELTVSHVSTVVPAVEPTCTENGLTEGEKCSVCGEILRKQEVVDALGHKEETIPEKAATCTKTGLTEGTECSRCGEILKKQEVIPVVAHTEEVIAGTAATCTKTGLTEGTKCSVCGKILKNQEVIPALGHTEEVIPGTAATCTKNGWTEGKRCSVCKVILKSQKVIKATGHKEEVIPAVAATPGHTGLTEGKKCSVCGEILVAQTETQALPILVTNVTVSAKTSVKIAAGKKVQLQTVIAPVNAENKAVTWKSSNKKVATVSSKGVVTMKKNAGGKTVVITATAKDGSKVYGSIKLTCTKGYVKKITISGKSTVKAGKSLTLKAKVTAAKKANKKVAWSSSNKKLATVTSKGVVKTFKGMKGTVKITARSLDGTNKKATFKIKIK